MKSDAERVAAVTIEIRDLHPAISAVVDRGKAIATSPKLQDLRGRDRATIRLPSEIGSEALERCKILVDTNTLMLETLGVISLTRYVYEMLLWLKTIEANPLKTLEFLRRALDDGEDHTRQHIANLVAEADYFDSISDRDDPVATVLRLRQEHGDGVTAEHFRAAEKERMDRLDLEARRRFSVFAAEARHNGYGFQAALIRKHQIPPAERDLENRIAARAKFVESYGQPLIDEAGGAGRWNWRDAAKRAGLDREHVYIYNYASRLLHASPASFYTSQKNLEYTEMRVFLEFTYVRLLDLIDVTTKFVETAERHG